MDDELIMAKQITYCNFESYKGFLTELVFLSDMPPNIHPSKLWMWLYAETAFQVDCVLEIYDS